MLDQHMKEEELAMLKAEGKLEKKLRERSEKTHNGA
jgi:hypothetical protein